MTFWQHMYFKGKSDEDDEEKWSRISLMILNKLKETKVRPDDILEGKTIVIDIINKQDETVMTKKEVERERAKERRIKLAEKEKRRKERKANAKMELKTLNDRIRIKYIDDPFNHMLHFHQVNVNMRYGKANTIPQTFLEYGMLLEREYERKKSSAGRFRNYKLHIS